MTDEALERLISEYHRRQAEGQHPDPEDFKEKAGDLYERFIEFIELDSFVERAVQGTGPGAFPMEFGDFTLLRILGEGGVGRVYEAVENNLQRRVALKVLHSVFAEDPDLQARFRHGATAAAQVEHDHVIRVYGHGVIEQSPYLAMSLLEGETLYRLLWDLKRADAAPFDEPHHAVLTEAGLPGKGTGMQDYVRRIAAAVLGVADALGEYADRGIVHRDVKPGNIILDRRGRLVLTDFDMAKGLDSMIQTHTGAHVGTPAYMSPEQWDRSLGEPGGATDVYGLGCVLFELLTLHRPFEDVTNPAKLFQRVTRGAAPDPKEHVPGLPDEACAILSCCLAPKPGDRYANGHELADSLRYLA